MTPTFELASMWRQALEVTAPSPQPPSSLLRATHKHERRCTKRQHGSHTATRQVRQNPRPTTHNPQTFTKPRGPAGHAHRQSQWLTSSGQGGRAQTRTSRAILALLLPRRRLGRSQWASSRRRSPDSRPSSASQQLHCEVRSPVRPSARPPVRPVAPAPRCC